MSDFFYFTVCKSAFLQFTLDRWRMAFQQLSSQCLLRPGKVLNHLSHSTASRGLLGSKEHAGFLYVRPTFQSLDGLPLPSQPFLFGLLILRAETPWARAFPLRLMLRLGAEYRCKCWRCWRQMFTQHQKPWAWFPQSASQASVFAKYCVLLRYYVFVLSESFVFPVRLFINQ